MWFSLYAVGDFIFLPLFQIFCNDCTVLHKLGGGGQGEPPNKLVKREIRKEEGRKKREVRLGQVQAK